MTVSSLDKLIEKLEASGNQEDADILYATQFVTTVKDNKKALSVLEKLEGDNDAAKEIGEIGRHFPTLQPRALTALEKNGSEDALIEIEKIGGKAAVESLLRIGSDAAVLALGKMAEQSGAYRGDILLGLLGIKTAQAAMVVGMISDINPDHQKTALTKFIELKGEFNKSATNTDKMPWIESRISQLFDALTKADILAEAVYDMQPEETAEYREYLVKAAKNIPSADLSVLNDVFDGAVECADLRRAYADKLHANEQKQLRMFSNEPK